MILCALAMTVGLALHGELAPGITCMDAPIRDLHRTELPRTLALATAVICGMLAAIVTQVLLARRGIELAGVWRDLFAARGLQLRAAGAWWAMVASAFIAGATVAAVISRFPLPWQRLRTLRWVAGAGVVFALAHVGHSASLKAGGGLGMHVAASLAALLAAALMALFGAYFAARR
jgi:hypothetical protein